ncbi:MAG TPA: TlpA disulfide reductase family protein [Victivallales bacterium]|nr:TlpA disulfide reductase family protein [Victivallales bacterium]
MKKISKTFLFLFSFILANNVLGLDIGDKAPKLEISDWVCGGSVKIEYNKNEDINKIYVLFFWAAWDGGSLHLLNFVEKENELFKYDDVVFIGISKENTSKIKQFLRKIPGIDINLGIDDTANTYNKYMSRMSGLPMFFIIGKDGKLLWKGPPFEVDRVIKKIVTGTFDTDEQLKIEKIRQKIRTASIRFEKDKIIDDAKNILKIDPSDETAINIIVQKFIDDREYKRALNFISSSKHEVHGNKFTMRFLYFYELRIINLMDNKNKVESLLKKLVNNYSVSFSNSPKALNELTAAILNDVPFELWPIDGLLRMSERAVRLETLFNRKSEQLGLRLQILAKIYYHLGKIDKALNTQIKANRLFKNIINEKKGIRLAEFYKKLLNFHIEKNASILHKQYSETVENLGEYLQTLGKVYYYLGDIEQAVITQKNANKLLREKQNRVTGKLLENFYKKTYKLSKGNL